MMNKISEKLMYALGAMAIVIALGVAGSVDYAEEVIYTMPDAAYKAIRQKLGEDASQREIAREYVSRQEFYDRLYK